MRVVLLTNILNPFRIFFYDKLRDEYAHHNVDFRVLVMVPNEPGRTWQYDDFRRDYTTLMKGGLKKVSGIDVIINPGIGRVIKKMNPDVMVCAGSYMLPSVWAAIGLKKKYNYKVLYWSESHLNEKRSYGSLKLAVRSFFRNTVISRFDGFWYAGKMSKEFIDTYASEDSYYVFVPNLIDERAYYIASKYSEEQKKVIRKSYNVADDNVMFLTPARLSKEKGILEFLDIMNDVPSKNKVTIVMPGQGELKEEIEKKIEEIKILLLPKDANDDSNVIIEIRQAAGGEESALFCSVLFRMYQMYADKKHWKVEVMDLNETELGGIKEITFMVKGKGAYSRFKYESGVHRVQRVPETESQGRIHTSTSTVAVLPEIEEVEFEIEDKDLKIDTYRSSGAGGQHVNKTESAIRITHLPTGIVVACQDERSQIKNRERAMSILRSKLYDYYQGQIESEYKQERKSQVGTGDRSERVRTYNYPQGRVTDHRVNVTSYNIESVLNGDLDLFIDALTLKDRAEKLANA